MSSTTHEGDAGLDLQKAHHQLTARPPLVGEGVGGSQDVRDVGKVEGFGKLSHLVTISHTPMATQEVLQGGLASNPGFL